MKLVYLEINDLDSFLQEIEKRKIQEVRVSDWRRVDSFILTLKCRLTAYDPNASMILRMEITYYRGLFEPNSQEMKQKIRTARDELVKPVLERIGKVARVEVGEFHLGSPRW